jgi:2-polyprenyl-3-methyl-5-hydroxy-6-metoxy-1,4-benzoquinol methylase
VDTLGIPSYQNQRLELVSCDFCGASVQTNKILRTDGLEVGECAQCGLAYLNPRPKWEDMLAHYQTVYFKETDNSISPFEIDTKHWNDMRIIERHVNLGGIPILDIGCEKGVLLYNLKCSGAGLLAGIEPSVDASKAARQLLPDAEIFNEGFEAVNLSARKFGLVSAIDLVEHIYSPKKFFSFAQQVVAPGGYLYLKTPNWSMGKKHGIHWVGLQWDYEHVYYFDKRTIINYLELYNFKPIFITYEHATGGLGDGLRVNYDVPTASMETDTDRKDQVTQNKLNKIYKRIPKLNNVLHRFIWYFRHFYNMRSINQETAHALIVLAKKK